MAGNGIPPRLEEGKQIASQPISFQIPTPSHSLRICWKSQGILGISEALVTTVWVSVVGYVVYIQLLLLASSGHFYIATVHSHLCPQGKSMCFQNSSMWSIEQPPWWCHQPPLGGAPLGHQAASHTGFLCFFHSINKYLSRICNVPDSLLGDGTVRVSRISWVLAVS